MTRNDAYKRARMVWRQIFKRGCAETHEARRKLDVHLAGLSERDDALVRVYLRAQMAGRRWPSESDIRRAEAIE